MERRGAGASVMLVAGLGAALVALGSDGGPADRGAGLEAEGRCVLRIELDGVISPAMADFVADATERAEASRCEALLVVLDTPGGLVDATRRIASSFLASEVPVVVHVAPGGARAASAGALVTLAAHVAVMAPGTNIGAAHPVTATGEEPGETMGRKTENDVAAFARSLAERRGRNVEWAERAVRESVSSTAEEALAAGVVDLVVEGEAALLERLDGWQVAIGGAAVRLRIAGATVRELDPSASQRVRAVLGNPSFAYLLLMLGVLGIIIELSNPGVVLPGAVGALSLLLAAIGLGSLPVHAGGVVLLLVAAVVLAAELFVTSYGLLTLGGLAALVLGSVLLLDFRDPDFFVEPSVGVSWRVVVPMATLIGLAAAGLGLQAAVIRRVPARTGASGLIGRTGRTVEPVGPEGGRVRVAGELWRARSDERLEAGSEVRVAGISGLRLHVTHVAGKERTASP